MSRWETTSVHETDMTSASIWRIAYADAESWPRWNAELKRASLDGPLAAGAEARIVFRTGLRLRFRVVEFEDSRLFTDEARLPVPAWATGTCSSRRRGEAAASPTPFTSTARLRVCGDESSDPRQLELCRTLKGP
jgi:hypothetical protein